MLTAEEAGLPSLRFGPGHCALSCPSSPTLMLSKFNTEWYEFCQSGGGGTRTRGTLSDHGFPSRYNGRYVTPPEDFLYLFPRFLFNYSPVIQIKRQSHHDQGQSQRKLSLSLLGQIIKLLFLLLPDLVIFQPTGNLLLLL